MRTISPGVVALRPFKVVVDRLTQDMVDWWIMQGAEAQVIDDHYFGRSGPVDDSHYRIRMPGVGSKWSHRFNDGTGLHMLHLHEKYAPTASLFIMKYINNIVSHSIEVPEPQLD